VAGNGRNGLRLNVSSRVGSGEVLEEQTVSRCTTILLT